MEAFTPGIDVHKLQSLTAVSDAADSSCKKHARAEQGSNTERPAIIYVVFKVIPKRLCFNYFCP